jgi:hypothetical protein
MKRLASPRRIGLVEVFRQLELMPRMTINPLRIISFAAFAVLITDFLQLLFMTRLEVAIVVRIVGFTLFLIAYFRKSTAAWYLAFLLNLLFVPAILISNQLRAQPREYSAAFLFWWLTAVGVVLLYLWRMRRRYFDYARSHRSKEEGSTGARA